MTTDTLATIETPTVNYSTIEQAIEALESMQMTFLANNVDCADTQRAVKELKTLLKQNEPCEPINVQLLKDANRSFLVSKVSNFKFSTLTSSQLLYIADILDVVWNTNQ